MIIINDTQTHRIVISHHSITITLRVHKYDCDWYWKPIHWEFPFSPHQSQDFLRVSILSEFEFPPTSSLGLFSHFVPEAPTSRRRNLPQRPNLPRNELPPASSRPNLPRDRKLRSACSTYHSMFPLLCFLPTVFSPHSLFPLLCIPKVAIDVSVLGDREEVTLGTEGWASDGHIMPGHHLDGVRHDWLNCNCA